MAWSPNSLALGQALTGSGVERTRIANGRTTDFVLSKKRIRHHNILSDCISPEVFKWSKDYCCFRNETYNEGVGKSIVINVQKIDQSFDPLISVLHNYSSYFSGLIVQPPSLTFRAIIWEITNSSIVAEHLTSCNCTNSTVIISFHNQSSTIGNFSF